METPKVQGLADRQQTDLKCRRQRFRVGAFFLVGVLALCLLVNGNAFAEDHSVPAGIACEGVQQGDRHLVTEIVDGDTVILDTGDQVRLVGLQAPKLALGRRNMRDWPLAEESKAQLSDLIFGQYVTLFYGGRREDRHGRLLAHLMLDDGRWVQGEMLRSGMARVYTFADNRACAHELLQQEQRARDSDRGIWAHGFYARRQATDIEGLAQVEDSFQLVEGQIVNVARVRNRVFLNFGTNWRDDFTLVIEGGNVRRFPADLEMWAGRQVRVRGWLGSYNGPEIRITHPEQVEFLDDFAGLSAR